MCSSDLNGIKVALIDAKADQILTGISTTNVQVGYGFTVAIPAGTTLPGIGITSLLGGYYKGVITEVGSSQISTKLVGIVTATGDMVSVDYQQNGVYALPNTGSVAIHTNGQSTSFARSYAGEQDWFEQQSITLSVGSIEWDAISNRPETSAYAAARGGRFDEVHVVVIDDLGTITGNAGSILEKHLNLSKAKDAEFSIGSPSYWRKYLETNSQYIFGGSQPVGVVTTGFSGNGVPQFELNTDTGWDQDAQDVIFAGAGSNTYTLASGKNYGAKTDLTTSGALYSNLDDIVSGLTLLENTEEYQIDFILMGSANYPKEKAQALANKCIAVAEIRKDALA